VETGSWDEQSYSDDMIESNYDGSRVSQNSVICDNKVKRRIVHGAVSFHPEEVWEKLSDGAYRCVCRDMLKSWLARVLAKALVSRLLIYNNLQRATVYSALQSRWITSELSELENAYQARVAKMSN
jgi:hypothetical protein